MDELNKRIVSIMLKTGHSKSTFASAIGVSLPLITHITSGRNKPGVEILQKIILQFTQINPVWLLTGDGMMEQEVAKNIDLEAIENNIIMLKQNIISIEKVHQTVLQYHKLLFDEVMHLHEMSEMIKKASFELDEIKLKLNATTALLS